MILESLLGEEAKPLMSSELMAAVIGGVVGALFGAFFSWLQVGSEWRKARIQHLLVTYNTFLVRELDWAIALANWSDADFQSRDSLGKESAGHMARANEALCALRGEDPRSLHRLKIAEALFMLNLEFGKLIVQNSSSRTLETDAWQGHRNFKRLKLSEQLAHLGKELPRLKERP